MIKFLNKILFLIAVLNSMLLGQQSLQQQYDLAEKLYNEGNYFDAVTELKRLVFFDSARQYYYKAYMLMGSSYKNGALLNDALSCFNTAERFSNTDNEKYNASIETIRGNILRRSTEQALKIIGRLEASGQYQDRQDSLNYWKGWAYIFSGSFDKAADVFHKIPGCGELDSLCRATDKSRYSEKLAKILSVFFPGAGQIYTGNYLNGIISLAWNIFAGYLTINSFAEDRVFDGIVTANLLWLRFYVGGIQNAEEFARDNNTAIINKTMLYLQNEFTGIKP
jgi:tetratricopeptide (TPR) repeat protein